MVSGGNKACAVVITTDHWVLVMKEAGQYRAKGEGPQQLGVKGRGQ